MGYFLFVDLRREGNNKGQILRGKKEELKEDVILNVEKVICYVGKVRVIFNYGRFYRQCVVNFGK